uniref:Retrotransposon gag domain-containing protein n=1 Tax=Musca domestica TaxID=7370 RepID=A0A1I8NKY6_MUSDO
MIYNTRNSKRNKRGRPENFDLNRSTYFPEQSKQRRIGSDEMANEDRNMSALQFIDLADTIMRRDQNTNHVPTVSDNVNNNGLIGPTTSDLHGLVQDEAASVQKSLEDKVKKMVETEISDVKRMVDSLSKGMRELSDTVRKQLIVPPTATVAANSITNSNANPTSNNNNDAVNRNMPPIIQFPSASQTPLSDQFTGPITNTFRVEPLGIRVDKLGLNFSGDPKGLRVMDFIKRLEIMQAQYNIPWSEVLRDFAFLVSGQAREWYWLHRQSNVYTDWVGLKEALISQYQTPQSKFDILRDMTDTGPDYKLNPHELTNDQENRLKCIVKKFKTFEENGLGCSSLEKHSIKLVEGAEPVKDRHYPMSPAVQAITYQEVDNMLALNVIEESESPWSNRTTIVRKPGKNRFCLDARKLNKLTVKDAYPLQNIERIVSRINETHYISSVADRIRRRKQAVHRFYGPRSSIVSIPRDSVWIV